MRKYTDYQKLSIDQKGLHGLNKRLRELRLAWSMAKSVGKKETIEIQGKLLLKAKALLEQKMNDQISPPPQIIKDAQEIFSATS